MKHVLLVLLLISQTGTLVMAQQVPATTPKTTAPAARTLTPAEQRQKEKIDREVQRDRQIRAEWAQKQREYEAKQAEKERQRQAKKAGAAAEAAKPKPDPVKVSPSVTSPAVAAPVLTSPASTAEPEPAVAEPTRKEKREKRKREAEAAKPKPVETPLEKPVETPQPDATVTSPALVEPTKPAEKPQRTRREKLVTPQRPDAIESPAALEPASVSPGQEFLPKGHLFEPILLDPLEAQTYGSFLPAYYTESNKYPGSIVPFAFGFAKPFYRRTTAPGRSSEWVLDLASFTQFELYYDYKLDKARRQIMNNDYKISIIYNLRRGASTYRFRVYHLSSHLADDYIYRNKITAPTPNPVNYEIVDATYSRNVRDWRLYGGIGIGLRKSEERKRFSAQIGAYYKKPSDRAARLVGGVDIKFWQQTDFRPGIHGGIGIELGRTQNNITFLVEGYSGFRPYSQFESQKTAWIGLGMYLNPF